MGVGDASKSAGVLVLELLKLVRLVAGLSCLGLVEVLQMRDLPVHLCSLDLNRFDLSLKVRLVTALVGALVTLRDSFLPEAASFEVLLVKKALGSGALIIEAQVEFGPTSMRKYSLDQLEFKLNALKRNVFSFRGSMGRDGGLTCLRGGT